MSRNTNFGVGSAPVEVAKAGADAFRAQADSNDYSKAIVTPKAVAAIGMAYNRLPEFQNAAVPAFNHMAEETKRQFDHMTSPRSKGGMGFEVGVTKEDPYEDTRGLFDHINQRKVNVLHSDVTGGHPVFDADTNNMFRAVHEVFGHAATGRGFDRHGEEAAFRAHASMFSPLARGAMATETRGQNHAMLSAGGQFQPQKIALLPAQMQHEGYANRGTASERAAAMLQAQQFHARYSL